MAKDLVIGLGTAGSLIVQRLLVETPYRLIRGVDYNDDWSKLKAQSEVRDAIASGRLELVQGDATDQASMRRAFDGVTGVAFFAFQGKAWRSAGKVDHNGVNTAAQAAAAAGVHRVLLISSLFVTEKHGRNPLRVMLNTVRWRMMDNKLWGEQRLRESGVPFTIVRPGRFVDKPIGAPVKLKSGQGDNINGSISPRDVAVICVAAAREPSTEGVTFEVTQVVDEWAKAPDQSPQEVTAAVPTPEEIKEAEEEGDVAYPSILSADQEDSKALDADSDDGIVSYPSLGGAKSIDKPIESSTADVSAPSVEDQLANVFLGLTKDDALVALKQLEQLSLQPSL